MSQANLAQMKRRLHNVNVHAMLQYMADEISIVLNGQDIHAKCLMKRLMNSAAQPHG